MSGALIGRSDDLSATERWLDTLADGAGVLVLEGEPGIGKTSLMRAGVKAARHRGARVLSCVPSASETKLAYAGLADLLRDVEASVFEELPEPQQKALDAALLRAGPAAADVDRLAVAAGAMSVLDALAVDSPVMVAVDDAQWLDRSTTHVVEFCARRFSGPLGMLASRRLGEADWVGALAGSSGEESVEVHKVEPLSPADLSLVLNERLGHPVDRRVLMRVHEASGGNPFYALEMARALPTDAPPTAALPLPESLDEVVASRMAGVEPEVEEALLAVAMLAQPTVDLLCRALGEDVRTHLDTAEELDMIELVGYGVRFRHPLLAAGIYTRAKAGRRRAMHERLSGVVTDVEERARHLAFARMPGAVAALDEAARSVLARGAPEAAADLLELALELGGGHDLRVRAAEHHFDAGTPQRSRTLLEQAVQALPEGERRALALTLLAEVRYKDDSFPAALELLQQAESEAGSDERLRVRIGLRLVFVYFGLGRLLDAVAPAGEALVRSERLDDPGLRGQILAVAQMIDFCTGHGFDEQRLAEARWLESHPVRGGAELQPSLLSMLLFLWTGRFEEARVAGETVVGLWDDRGEEHAIAWVTGFAQVWLECWAGDLAGATETWRLGSERLRMIQTTNGAALALTAGGMVDAYAGRVDEARRRCGEAITLLQQTGWLGVTVWPLMTLGFAEMSVGNHEGFIDALGPAVAAGVAAGLPEPLAAGALITADAAEALAALGRIDEAEAIVSLLEQRGAETDRAWTVAVGARCRGILLAAKGDVEGAEAALERAVVAHERLPMPIERARSLLVLGRIRRRARKRLAAKAALEEALSIFESVGSPRWAEQASAEIDGLGLRPTTSHELTPSEERVARLAATGLTNEQVAAALIVSPKTVEAHLGRAYRKLGIRSRAELGGRFSSG